MNIPNSVTSIGEFAFWDTGWYYNQQDGILYLDGCLIGYKGEKPTGELVIKEGTVGISANAFQNCSGLTSVNIPNSVLGIGNRAFEGCSGLPTITIPNKVSSIGIGAFRDCTDLLSAIIGNSVTNIGELAFDNCISLQSIDIPNSVTTIGHQAFSGCTGLTSVIIPNSVTSIGMDAFQKCSGLTSVTISKSVTSIERGTFAYCENLTSIIIPDGVTSITRDTSTGNIGAFQGCSNLQSITIPNSVTSIGENTFSGCSSLTTVSFPNSVTNIGNGAFQGCSSLTVLPISEGATNIGSYAFAGCSSLSSVTIPISVTSIGDQAFLNCSKMETLKLPDELQIIRRATFKGCNSLKSITIPSTVEFIYQEAFANCDALEIVKAKPGTPPFLYDNSFSNFSVPLEVRKGCKEGYQTAQGWKNFTNISESDKGYYKLVYLVDNEEYKSCKIEDGAPITPEPAPTKEGYTFSGWSEIPEIMPAHDVTVTGTFAVNKYKLVYKVDGAEYKSYELEYGAAITPEPAPTKEGYTFSGWSEIPASMPAHDVTVTGTFSVNKYKLTYTVDGEEYKSYELEYGANITSEPAPTKEGYTFSGWSEIPETMPAYDVAVTGSFTINSYKLTYMIDDKVFKETMYEYGATITTEPQPEGDYATFEWTGLPQTMPAHDVVVYASYTSGINIVLMTKQRNIRIYSPNGKKLDKLHKGMNIIRMNDGRTKKIVVK